MSQVLCQALYMDYYIGSHNNHRGRNCFYLVYEMRKRMKEGTQGPTTSRQREVTRTQGICSRARIF